MPKQSIQFTTFLFGEGMVWLALLILAPLIMTPAGIWHGDYSSITWFEALLFSAFVIGVIFYLRRLATYAFDGKLVQREILTLHLPSDQKRTIKLPKFSRGKVIIFLHNAKLSWLHGDISVKTGDQSETLSDVHLTEPKGRVVKNIRGEQQTVLGGKRSARADRVAMLSFSNKTTKGDEVLLDLNLDWNFQGWNSALEKRLPSDKNLTLEVLVRAV